jgi:hypothetical protein
MNAVDRFTMRLNARLASTCATCWFWRIVAFGFSLGVAVRNTILGLNGYTSSAAAATTTELPTSGDFGIHKNTTSGNVHLCFNDAGTIRSVLMT